MGDQWRRRMAAAGVPMSLWQRRRAAVAATLPAPCTVCGDMVQPWHTWHLEHVVPISSGGPAFPVDVDGLGPAHATCNLRKGNRSATPRDIPRSSRAW